MSFREDKALEESLPKCSEKFFSYQDQFRLVGEVLQIHFPNGKFSIVDAADADWVRMERWYLRGNRAVSRGGVPLSHFIAGIPLWGKVVDHINEIPLDNRRRNLDVISRSKNTYRSGARPSRSGVRGVAVTPSGRWKAVICHLANVMHLGTFDTLEQARAVRRAVARAFWGLNIE